jgi:DNA polymerase-3 subunit epsilon
LRHAAKGPPFHSGPLATYRNGPVSSNVRRLKFIRRDHPVTFKTMNSVTKMPEWAYSQNSEFNQILNCQIQRVERYFFETSLTRKADLLVEAMAAYLDLEDRARRFQFFLKVRGLTADKALLEDERKELFTQGVTVNWPISLNLVNVLFVDTETTGLGVRDQPVSIGAILAAISPNTGRCNHEIGEYYGLRQPSCPIAPGAVRVHGLTHKELSGKDFDYVAISAMVGVADLIVAHNAKFDQKMLSFLNIDESLWSCSCYDISWPQGAGGRSLDAVCRYLNIDRVKPHNAMSDTRAMFRATQTCRANGLAYLADITIPRYASNLSMPQPRRDA